MTEKSNGPAPESLDSNGSRAEKPEPQNNNTLSAGLSQSSIGSERVVLAALLTRSDFKPDIEQTAFFGYQHSVIYGAICRLREAGRPADLVSVTEALLGERMDVPPTYLADLADEIVIDANSHVDRLRALDRRRQLSGWAEGLRAAAHDGDEDAIQRLTQLIDKASTKAPGKISISALPLTADELESARITPDCIVENYLYADVAVLAAPGGTGKTTLEIYEAICITIGRPVHGLKVCKPGKVLLVTAEDRREQCAARLREIMAGMDLTPAERQKVLDGFLIWDVTGENLRLIRLSDGNILPSDLADQLVNAFRQDPPVLIVFDPVVSFGVSEGLINDNEQGIITACRRIIRELNCCVRLIAHTGKSNAREGTLDQYSSRGGSALSDGSRMFAVLKAWTPDNRDHTPPPGCIWTPETSITILARPKLSYAPPQPHIWIARNGWQYDAFVEVKRTADEKRAEVYDTVISALEAELEAGARHSKSSLEGAIESIPRAELRKAISRLMALGRIVEVDLPANERRTRKKTYLTLGNLAGPLGDIPKIPPENKIESCPVNNAAALRENNGGIIPPPIIPHVFNVAGDAWRNSATLAELPDDDENITVEI